MKEKIESVLRTVGNTKSKNYFDMEFQKSGGGIRKESAEREPKGAAPDFCVDLLLPPLLVHLSARRRRSSEKETVENHTTKNNKLTQAYYKKEQNG